MVLFELLLPNGIIGTVNTGIEWLGIIGEQIGEVLQVFLLQIAVGILFDILFDNLLETFRGGRQRFSILQSMIHVHKIRVQDVDSIKVSNQMANLEKHHVTIVIGANKIRLDDNAVQIVNGFLSDLIDKGVLLFFGFKGQNGHLLDIFSGITKVLHQLSLLFEESDSEAVISLDQKLESLIHKLKIHFLINGDRGKDVDYSFV
jgi:hypothetical protein